MAWSLAARLLGLGTGTEPSDPTETYDDPLSFPAGVVALGRGGAGAIGALVRHDGAYVGLLCLEMRCERGREEVAALAETLPLGACQFLTVRWPVAAARAAAAWRTRGRSSGASIANLIADRYLPSLIDAGWSDVHSLFVLARPDAESLHRDLLAIAASLPFPSRPATLDEVKLLVGDWFLPQAAGDVTIGWSVTELTAEPPSDWARQILEESVLAGVPTMLTLHLAPAGAPEPISLAVRRQLQELDSAIEARRRHGRHADDLLIERRELLATVTPVANPSERPRPARLLLGCTVPSESARALRDEVEPLLHRLGFHFAAHGPRLSRDLHLSCAPLVAPLVGRGITLTSRGAALLAPQVAASADQGDRRGILPLGLRRDGAALWPNHGEGLLITGAVGTATTLAQTWALGAAAQGSRVAVVATHGGWDTPASALGAEVVSIALNLGGALSTLGIERLRRQPSGTSDTQIGDWAAALTNILTDLCPDLAEDDLGDLTGALLVLAEGALAWGEPLRLQALVAQLQTGGSAARHLATLLLSTLGNETFRATAGDSASLVVYDASSDHAGERIAPPPGCAAVALHALLGQLATEHPDPHHSRIIVIDDLSALLEGLSGIGLLHELLAEARRIGATIWYVASSLATCPRDLLLALREHTLTLVVSPDAPESLRLLARSLDLPLGLFDSLLQATVGEVVVVCPFERDTSPRSTPPSVIPIRTLPLPFLTPRR